MTRQQRHQRARAKWQKLISQQAQSGQTAAEFCRARKLCVPLFFKWKKRLREAPGAETFVEVKVEAAGAEVGAGAAIEVRLRNERRLLVQPGFAAGHLRALLAVLEGEA